MVLFRKHCITKKLYDKAKRRILNKTRRYKNGNLKLVNREPTKFLTLDELYGGGEGGGEGREGGKCQANEIIKYAKKLGKNRTSLHVGYRKRLIELKQLRQECVRHLGKAMIHKLERKIAGLKRGHKELIDIDTNHYVYKELGKQYENYKIGHFCKQYDVLNVDKLSQYFDYFDIKGFAYNPSSTVFSFCVDFIGNRNYHFFVKDVYSNRIKHVPLHRKNESFISIHQTMSRDDITKQMSENYMWIDDETILYVAHNKYYNSSQCYTYHIPSDNRKLVYESKDHRELNIHMTHGEFYGVLVSSSYHSDEVFVMDLLEQEGGKKTVECIEKPVLKDKAFVTYPYVDHIYATWYILRDDAGEYTFMKTMDFRTFEILFKKKTKGFYVQDVYYMNELFVFFVRVKSESRLFLFDMCKGGFRRVDKGGKCEIQNSCHFEVMNVIPEQNKIYFHSSSFTKPNTLFMLEIDKERNHVVERVGGGGSGRGGQGGQGGRNDRYVEKVVYLKQKSIQVTLLYKKGLKLRNCKCVLYGYGAYGDHYDSTFNASNLLTLCDMGFLVVISQVSGDRTLGFDQRKRGMLLQKKNTFHDFIYIIEEYLYKDKITSRDKLAIWGRSAGGLLIGAVLNMRPDICKVAILGVPFVSPFLVMTSSKNPLAFESHSEWGNPLKQPNADYILSYSPIQNVVSDGNYPHMFIYSNLNDTLVPYTEPYFYYHTLKKEVGVFRENEKDLCLHIEDKFGHSQGSALKDKHYQFAMIFAFIQKHIRN